MKKYDKYKIAIFILSLIIILQWIFIIVISKPRRPAPAVPAVIKGKIAIVIDDWGYNLSNLGILDNIKYPLTASILPNLHYSKRVAQELHKRAFQIILHLPMQPHGKYRLEKNTILTTSDEKTIKNIIDKDLLDIVYAKGVSNHMGSMVTEDERVMEIIFGELKRRNLYFLDSFVSSKSVCAELAGRMNLHFARRDIFLDNIEEPEYIIAQFEKLKSEARSRGFAVGIGHDRKVTLQVLSEAMPKIEKEGYRFVFLSELVR
jgi:hypothetical protein